MNFSRQVQSICNRGRQARPTAAKRATLTAIAAMLLFALTFLAEVSAQDFQPVTFDQPTQSLPADGFALPTVPADSNGFEISTGPMQVAENTIAVAPAVKQTQASELSVISSPRLTDVLRRGGMLMVPIGICSFILVVFVFERLVSLRKARIIPGPFTRRFLEQMKDGDLNRESAITLCDRNNSPVANVFKAGVMKWGRPAVEVEQAVLDEGERTSNQLRKYLRLINGIATVCPLLGLLGTVLGMIHAFDSLASVTAGPNPQAVIATGISQALLTTAAGLTVAIPALIAYLFFSSRADRHVMEIDSLGMKIVNMVSAESIVAQRSTTRSTSSSKKKAA